MKATRMQLILTTLDNLSFETTTLGAFNAALKQWGVLNFKYNLSAQMECPNGYKEVVVELQRRAMEVVESFESELPSQGRRVQLMVERVLCAWLEFHPNSLLFLQIYYRKECHWLSFKQDYFALSSAIWDQVGDQAKYSSFYTKRFILMGIIYHLLGDSSLTTSTVSSKVGETFKSFFGVVQKIPFLGR